MECCVKNIKNNFAKNLCDTIFMYKKEFYVRKLCLTVLFIYNSIFISHFKSYIFKKYILALHKISEIDLSV